MHRILAQEGINVCASEWGKAPSDGLYEFRLRDEIQRQSVTESILLRVFFHAYGRRIILLLGGYDKGADPSNRRQQREIDEARRRLIDFKERQLRQRKCTSTRRPHSG